MPSTPPVGSILLLRRALPSTASPDLFRITANYYTPATRTAASYTMGTSSNGTEYDRPTTDIIDRWCDNPGVAPFREIQVHHNGTGGIDLVPVDGVTACQPRACTLAVTLTASAVLDGRGVLTATVTGAVGAYLLSLDGFQTAGHAPAPGTAFVEFTRLRPGTYTVTARETRVGGCVATASAALTVAYGPRYEVHGKNIDNVDCLLRISEREYTGAVEELEAQPNFVALDWPGGATSHFFDQLLLGSQCQQALYLSYDEQLLPLFSGDERLHLVEYFEGGGLMWKGYELPEQYDVQFLAPPAVFNLSATDGLGTLSDVPFVGSAGESLRGDWTALAILLHCLNKLDLALPLNVLLSLYPGEAQLGAPAVEQIRFDVATYADDKGKPWDCGKVLNGLLTAFQARLYQFNGAWWLERLAELSIEDMAYVSYDPTGLRLADVTRNALLSVRVPQDGQPHWLNADQRQNLRPAVARVTVKAEPGEAVNLLAFALPTPEQVPPGVVTPTPPNWSAAPALVPAAHSLLVYEGATKTPLLRLTGTTENAATPERAAWVQTPDTAPVPIGTSDGSYANQPGGGFVSLSFTAKPYGNTPTAVEADMSRLLVAVRIGGVWVKNNGQESTTTPLYEELRFPDSKEQVLNLDFGRLGQRVTARQAVAVRLVGPLGGARACTVDLSDLLLTWENDNVHRDGSTELDDRYTSTYTTDTGQLVSRVDEGLTLTQSDTPAVRRAGTPLDYLGRPVRGWQEPAGAGQLRELGDYLVRDRALWQAGPTQVLTGTLRGPFPGPGVLLTDPNETRPAVYALTGVRHDADTATWTLTAVQNRQLIAPPLTMPENAIYNEDDDLTPTAWLDESGLILVYE